MCLLLFYALLPLLALNSAIPSPSASPLPTFQVWLAVVPVIMVFLIVTVALVIIIIFYWKVKKKKRKLKISPDAAEGVLTENIDGNEGSEASLSMTAAKSLTVLVPEGEHKPNATCPHIFMVKNFMLRLNCLKQKQIFNHSLNI